MRRLLGALWCLIRGQHGVGIRVPLGWRCEFCSLAAGNLGDLYRGAGYVRPGKRVLFTRDARYL